MILGQIWIIFCVALFRIGLILSTGDYSSDECQGTATKCSIPTPAQIERIQNGFSKGGCTAANTQAERQRFVECAKNANPQLDRNISELTNSDQQCKDETIDFEFPDGFLAECAIYGTPLAKCYIRCAACLRYEAFGFDSTEINIKQIEDCDFNANSNSGTDY